MWCVIDLAYTTYPGEEAERVSRRHILLTSALHNSTLRA